jgi:exo-beta-1,3-glucanase (GH17 family)
MTSTQIKTTSSFALTAALLALSASAFAADAPKGSSGKAIASGDKVHCYNVHDCKGNSDCKTAEHACKGQNACKGHGFKAKTAGECLAGNGVIGDLK